MMPCSPPIAFCNTVGQAIFQTARAMRPFDDASDRVRRRGRRRYLDPRRPASGADEPGAVSPAADGPRWEALTGMISESLNPRYVSSQRLDGASDVGMCKHDRWLPLQRVEVAPCERLASLGGRQEPLDLIDERGGVGRRRRRFGLDGLIDPDDELGQRMQPREPGIVDDELQQRRSWMAPVRDPSRRSPAYRRAVPCAD